ncbi:MAG: serine/threonine protein kinase [Anaerolineae bacterium]|jgi:tRNA A-37 threonylcarbamoyl transferase component Bud32|nr:serine/threonine protein kinase [Anaerolineae bacterium]
MSSYSTIETKITSNTTRRQLQSGQRRLARLAWMLITAFVVVIFAIGLPAHIAETATPTLEVDTNSYRLHPDEVPVLATLGLSPMFYALYLNFFNATFMIFFVGIGIYLFYRSKDDWLVMLVALTMVLFGVTGAVSLDSLAARDPAWTNIVTLIKILTWTVGLQMFYLFPDGRYVPAWIKYPAWIWTVWLFSTLLFPMIGFTALPNFTPTLLLMFLTGFIVQLYRYRSVSDEIEREQAKWVASSLIGVLIGFSVYLLIPSLISPLSEPGLSRVLFRLFAIPALIFLPLYFIPFYLGTAILRYRLWDLNLVMNRSIFYSAFTIFAGVFYFGSILLLQQIFISITGAVQSPVAVGIASLILFMLFQPLRQVMERILRREWNDPKPVAQTTPIPTMIPLETEFNGYRILQPLSRTGMSEVYLGQHVTLNRKVAIKILSANLAIEENFRIRFEREARLVASLRHANIVQLYDFGVLNGTYYMVMEFLEGMTLGHHLKRHGVFSLDDTRQIVGDLANALGYAHEQGVIHRDIKPANVMIHPQDTGFKTVLMDFGIVKLIGTGTTGVTRTEIIGTVDYIAPEQAASSKQIDGRADQYALGVMVYEMLTGCLPFTSDNPLQMLLNHLQALPPDPRTINPAIPETTAFAILRALSKDPGDRFNTIHDFAQAL